MKKELNITEQKIISLKKRINYCITHIETLIDFDDNIKDEYSEYRIVKLEKMIIRLKECKRLLDGKVMKKLKYKVLK